MIDFLIEAAKVVAVGWVVVLAVLGLYALTHPTSRKIKPDAHAEPYGDL
jgi:hypothetical protein